MRTGTNAAPIRGESFYSTKERDQLSYDKLPRELQRLLDYSHVDFSAEQVHTALERGVPKQRIIDHMNNLAVTAAREDVKVKYGDDHPSLTKEKIGQPDDTPIRHSRHNRNSAAHRRIDRIWNSGKSLRKRK